MAQSLLLTPPASTNSIRSPTPKRFRFSLKHDRSQPQEPADFATPCKKSLVDTSLKIEEDSETDNCGVQDENVSPNRQVPERKVSVFVNLAMVDKKTSVCVLGLPNCGNTCYLNSILQVLRYTPNFLNCVHTLLSLQTCSSQASLSCIGTKEAELFQKLHMLYITMKKQEDFLNKGLDEDLSLVLSNQIESFLLCLREVSSLFEEGEQHDAHEFLFTILSTFSTLNDCLKASMAESCSRTYNLSMMAARDTNGPSSETLKVSQSKEKRKSKKQQRSHQLLGCSVDESLFKGCKMNLDIPNLDLGFEGKIRHIIQCLECEKKLERDEPFINLEISIADELIEEGSVDLCSCLNHKIILSGENKYFCEDCCHLSEAQLSSEVTSLPSILVIHCSWLKQSSIITHLEKDNTSLLIPTSIKTSENSQFFHTSLDGIYCLYAVVLHLGSSTENGHYVSFIRDSSMFPSLTKKENSLCIENCCGNADILNMKNPENGWLLFDDQTVTPISVNETTDTFPYNQLLGIAASPSIIFYYKM